MDSSLNIIYTFDLIGVLVFAISGVLAAFEKEYDLVGAITLAFVTAVGGGTLRDLMIGEAPVGWMKDLNYIYIIFLAVPLCYFFRVYILKLKKSLFTFDTIGIGLYTILGLQKTLDIGLSPIIAILMGIVSAVFGGVIRDVLANREPLLFRKEIYATACFIGAVVFIFLESVIPDHFINLVISILTVIFIRYMSVKRKWTLQFSPKN